MKHETSFVIVEDHATVLAALLRRIQGLPGPAARVRVLDPAQAMAERAWLPEDLVLVAATRHPRAQDADPAAPLLCGPEVAAHVSACAPGARVVVYGGRAAWPEVNITSRQAGATAVYEESVLIDSFVEIVTSPSWPRQVPRPTPQDFADIGLQPHADVWQHSRR